MNARLKKLEALIAEQAAEDGADEITEAIISIAAEVELGTLAPDAIAAELHRRLRLPAPRDGCGCAACQRFKEFIVGCEKISAMLICAGFDPDGSDER